MNFFLSKVPILPNNQFFLQKFISYINFVELRHISLTNIDFVKNNRMKESGIQLAALRKLMKQLPDTNESIDAYIVTSDDPHQSEWTAAQYERRKFICGFDGSEGICLITQTNAALWTDGRYYQQAGIQLDKNWTLMKDGLVTTPKIEEWINQILPPGSKIGIDPNLTPFRLWENLEKKLNQKKHQLIPIETNLVDLIWPNRPSPKETKIFNLGLEYAGRTTGNKLIEVRKKMIEKNADVLVVTGLDEIAYFLNLRGSDIDYNPLFFSYLIITVDEVIFFVDKKKLVNIEQHLSVNEVTVVVRDYDDVKRTLNEIVSNTSKKIWISKVSSYGITKLIPEERRLQEKTILTSMKAVKNNVEVQGMINCHIRDGLALCQYFAWLEKTLNEGGDVDEISGSTKLEEFRSKQDKFVGISFPTISGSGPNGSIIHYCPTSETKRKITKQEMYLCDSGAQYFDGTTDVTRTVHFGTPTSYQIECNTRVLKGQINLGTTIFPNSTKGNVLDTLARKSLWDVGLDYAHGTGHGVGSFLCVHEGPIGVGFRERVDDSHLQANMFISNEPGYYEDGEFGIRIEDIVQIIPAKLDEKRNFAGRGGLTFNTVTMCPIQTKLINVSLLTETERKHINDYHKRVLDTLLPLLESIGDNTTATWLKRETVSI